MLCNNLDNEVARIPKNLVVYGGRGKAARNWECFHAIVHVLRDLKDDETLSCNRASRSRYFQAIPAHRAY